MRKKEEMFDELSNSVVDYDLEKAKRVSNEVVDSGVDAGEAIALGLSAGMTKVGQLYDQKKMYLPQVMAASETMYAALDVLVPHLRTDSKVETPKKLVMCTAEGDVHSIGRQIVCTLMRVSGYEVTDLGHDIPASKLIDEAERLGADAIGMSTLMTSTMIGMQDVMRILDEKGTRSRYKVAIGGAPVNQDFCDRIGADMTAENAEKAVKKMNRLFNGGN